MIPHTVNDLIQWLRLHCYNRNYQILEENALDGEGLGQLGTKYYWFRRERGNMAQMQYFDSEQEAVTHAFYKISRDRFARRHLLRVEPNRFVAQRIAAELALRNLEYELETVQVSDNFGLPGHAIYVYGCDLKKALDLKYKEY